MFFGHCYRTRFCDSFCLASVFEMTVYLLTYLPHPCVGDAGPACTGDASDIHTPRVCTAGIAM